MDSRAVDYQIGRCRLVTAECRLLADGVSTGLGKRAVNLLRALIERRDRLVTKEELFQIVWPGRVVEENNLQVQVSSLRKLLGVRSIVTHPGRGYQFVATVEEHAAGVPPPAEQRSNLPAPASSFIGRAEQRREVAALLAGNPLVTLAGAAGIGKTRLALRVGADTLGQFPDGAWFIELAPLADPQLVAEAVAAVLGLDVRGASAASSAVTAFLRQKTALLILDNCEHLVGACAGICDTIVRACPGVRVLATSREPLGVAGESIYRVPPLGSPPEGQVLTADDALEYEAVRLFVARAKAACNTFVLGDDNATDVATICSRLDGIALAIELAAPRISLFDAERLLRRLDERFALLTSGARTSPPRQQSLRGSLDWSYELLSESERALLRRLAVFVDGCTLDSARAVVTGELVTEAQVFDLLSALVDKSLLAVDATRGEPRFKLLESTRQYAGERLAESGEAGYARRLAAYLARLLERAESEWRTVPTDDWLDDYGAELKNLRASLAWAFGAHGDAALGLELFAYTGELWREMSLQGEFRRWLEVAVERISEACPPPIAGRLWLMHAQAGTVGSPRFIESAERSIAHARTAGETPLLANALAHAAYLVSRSRPERAVAWLSEAHDLLAPLGRTKNLAGVLNIMAGLDFVRGDSGSSRRHYARAIAISQQLGHWRGYAAAAWNEIDERFHQGDEAGALADAARLVEQARARRSWGLLGLFLFHYGDYLLVLGEPAQAGAIALEGIELNRSLARDAPVNACLETAALAALRMGLIEPAARLAGYVGTFYRRIDFVRSPTQQRTWDELNAALAGQLPKDRLAHLTTIGSDWNEDDAVREAAEVLTGSSATLKPVGCGEG
jgi:predicted ATPase/DNA-binding winged helix-turn-helix (wHTH) protein